jgi:DNA-binding SARP family transcriptional activator/predicted ATPase
MPTLHVHLLGDFYIGYGDEPVTAINDTRLQSLLAYLLLHRHARQSRQHIAFLLWPDSNEFQARANLRKTLHHLRRKLPDAERFFHIDARSLQWRPDAAVMLDVAEFEGKLSQIDALDAADQAPVRAALEEATALYRGDLLPGCYDDWILAEREELRQRFMEALERLARLLEDQRDYPGAIHFANRLLRYDPLNETTYQRLMRLHALAGDRAGALRIYHTCTTELQRDLGVEPGPEVQALYARLLNRDAPEVLELQASQSREVAHLVGRHAEWRALQSAWRSAACGRAQFFLLGGVAGIGKSRLAEELRTWAREQGIATAWTRAYMAAGRLAFASIAEWLRTATLQAALEKLDEVWLTELARLLPELLVRNPHLPRPEPLAERWQRQRLFQAMAKVFTVDGQSKLLVIDDLQWCDSDTLEWLSYLLRSEPQARLLVVGTARLEEVDTEHPLTALLLDLRRTDQVTEVELNSLTAQESADLAAQVAGMQLDADMTRQLYDHTEGNPLFVVETIRAGQHDRSADRDAPLLPSLTAPPELARFARSGSESLPPKMRAVIQSRLNQLSPAARALACLAAVIGRSFSFAVLRRADGGDEAELIRSLDELWRRRIIREQGADGYDFSHDRIREVAYTGVSSARRRLLHRRVGEALEQIYAGNLDPISGQLAAHYEHAGLPEQALAFYQRAAGVAQRIYAHAEASSHLSKGLGLLGHLPLTADRLQQELRLQLALGHSLTVLKGPSVSEVSTAFARARALADQVGDDPQRMHALSGLYLSFMTRGQLLAAHDLAQQELSLAQRAGNVSMLFKATVNIGYVLAYLGQWRASRTYLEQALAGGNIHWHPSASYGPIQHPALACRRHLALVLWHLGYPDQARAHMDEVVVQAEALAHPYSLAAALTWSTWLRHYQREAQATQAQAETAIVFSRQHGFPLWEAKCTVLAGWAQAHQGWIQEGIARMQEGLAARQAMGTQLHRPALLAMLAEVYGQAGQPSQGLLVLNEAFTHIEVTGERCSEAELHRLKEELLRMQGANAQEVEPLLLQALAIAQQQEAKSLELRAAMSLSRLWQQQGRQADAYELLAGIYSWFTEGFDTADLQEAKALLAQLGD